jgi:hypothetical protein
VFVNELDDVQPIDIAHPQVRHDHMEGGALDFLDPLRPAISGLGFVARPRQQVAQGIGHPILIVND